MSFVLAYRAQVDQHQDMSSELVKAKQELFTTAAELADAQSQAAAYQQLQDLLEGWDIPAGAEEGVNPFRCWKTCKKVALSWCEDYKCDCIIDQLQSKAV